MTTGHRRCPIGVECGGHSWSRDGLSFSNLTVGAFGPYITFKDGRGWNNSYSERPLVTQNDDGSPLSFVRPPHPRVFVHVWVNVSPC